MKNYRINNWQKVDRENDMKRGDMQLSLPSLSAIKFRQLVRWRQEFKSLAKKV